MLGLVKTNIRIKNNIRETKRNILFVLNGRRLVIKKYTVELKRSKIGIYNKLELDKIK